MSKMYILVTKYNVVDTSLNQFDCVLLFSPFKTSNFRCLSAQMKQVMLLRR